MEENILAFAKNEEDRKAVGKPPRKKKSKTTKKSLAKENEKRMKFLHTLLECDVVPSTIKGVLKLEEQDSGHLYRMTQEEVERMWSEVFELVRVALQGVVEGESRAEREGVIRACVDLMLHTVAMHPSLDNDDFLKTAALLNHALNEKSCSRELQNKMCELSEYCCVQDAAVDGIFYVNTLNSLLDITLDEKDDTDQKPVIKRMWEMHVAMSRMNLCSASCDTLLKKLTRVIISPAYLSCKEGRQFIAYTFTMETKLIKKFHQAVKDFLTNCKRGQASSYGEVYYSAWLNGSAEVREILETHCIQNFMTHMFVFPRKKQEMSHTGQNVFAILSYLHHHRSLPTFSKKLTELYMPLLWRHLRSGNNIERCNAAEVFLDIYPLEKPGSGKAEESDFWNRQHNEMVDLLTDDCHVVRIIAIKGICSILISNWDTFPQESIQVIFRNLMGLANDGSNAVVRRTLYDSLRMLLQCEHTAAYLARILPFMRDHIHDENEKVRRAFVKLLCQVKSLPEPPVIRYWKIVPMNHLAARLELENYEVGSVLCKLLMTNIYAANFPADKFLFRLLQFARTSPIAARRLFQFSKKELEYKDALRLMLTVLLNLRQYVKRKEGEASTAPEPEASAPVRKEKKRRRSLETLQPVNEQDESVTGDSSHDKENQSGAQNRQSLESTGSSNKSTEEEKDDDFEEPGVAHALVDICSLLWSMHSESLLLPEHEEDLNNLYTVACAGIPLFLKYFKGSPTYWGVIHLASLVPASKLTPVSTACSACVSHLKQLSEVTPLEELQVIVHALCFWNRFAEIQDIVVDWLDQAFRCEGLNQSKLPDEKSKHRKVRFVPAGGKPMLALRVLDAVFSHAFCHKRVIDKAYNQLHELYLFMDRIKILVERRLLGGLPLDSPMLGDDFLLQCLFRYTKLIVTLHRPEPQPITDDRSVIDPFDASTVFTQLIQWATTVVSPSVPQRLEEVADFSVLVMKDILRTAANLVDLEYVDINTLKKLGEFIHSLLTSDCSLWFVEPSVVVLKLIKDHAEASYGPEDQEGLMRRMVSALLSQVLKALSCTKYTKNEVATCFEKMHEVKAGMFEVVQCLKRMFGLTHTVAGMKEPLFTVVLKLFTDSLVATILHDVKQLQLLDPADKVQELHFPCGLLLSVVARPAISPLWLATLPSSISQLYSQDADHLGAVVCLLHTLVHCAGEMRLPQAELQAAVREAYQAVTCYTRDSTTPTLDTTMADPSDSIFSAASIDVKKAAAPILEELACFLKCPLT